MPFLRYGDDMVAFADDRATLRRVHSACEAALATLRLRLHPTRCRIFPVSEGTLFLGFVVGPDRRRLDRRNVRAFRRRLAGMRQAWRAGRLARADARRRIDAWIAHAAHGDTNALRRALRGSRRVRPPSTERHRTVRRIRGA